MPTSTTHAPNSTQRRALPDAKPADISEDTWARLKKHAVPLEDTLDTLLERLITTAQMHRDCPRPTCATLPPAEPKGPPNGHVHPPSPPDPTDPKPPVQGNPLSETGQPTPRTVRQISHVILRYIESQGGTALEQDTHRHIAHDLNPPLNAADLHLHTNNEPRWRKNARTARYQLTKARLLEPGPDPHTFQLTAQAREHLRRLDSSQHDQTNGNTHFTGSFYSTTILDFLVQEGGTAKADAIIRRIGAAMTPLFTPADLEHLHKKGPRWRSKVNDAAHSLRGLGYLATPTRATWEITPLGRQSLQTAVPPQPDRTRTPDPQNTHGANMAATPPASTPNTNQAEV